MFKNKAKDFNKRVDSALNQFNTLSKKLLSVNTEMDKEIAYNQKQIDDLIKENSEMNILRSRNEAINNNITKVLSGQTLVVEADELVKEDNPVVAGD